MLTLFLQKCLFVEQLIFCDFIFSHDFLLLIPDEHIKDLVLLCIENTRFYFDGKVFKQIDGVVMRSPLDSNPADDFRYDRAKRPG